MNKYKKRKKSLQGIPIQNIEFYMLNRCVRIRLFNFLFYMLEFLGTKKNALT